MIGYIYKYENCLNGKIYIGQTTNINSRIASHKNKSKTIKNKFYNAVRKYGWESFKFSILTTIEASSIEELTEILDKLEIAYIKKYDSYNSGYNATLGGHSKRGYKQSIEFVQKCKNRKYSIECRNKMSIAAKNRIVSKETREKHRVNAINRKLYQLSKSSIQKRNKRIKDSLGKSIIQLDNTNTVINEFPAIIDAIKYIQKNLAQNLTVKGIHRSLYRHCNNLTKKREYYGFIWKYKSNV